MYSIYHTNNYNTVYQTEIHVEFYVADYDLTDIKRRLLLLLFATLKVNA